MLSNYVTNCPNCGAVLKGYGRCAYCGTVVDQPIQLLAIRPGVKKLEARGIVPLWIGEKNPDVATNYAIRQVRDQMVEGITDAIKFTVSRDYRPQLGEEVICVRGELWISEPNASV